MIHESQLPRGGHDHIDEELLKGLTHEEPERFRSQ